MNLRRAAPEQANFFLFINDLPRLIASTENAVSRAASLSTAFIVTSSSHSGKRSKTGYSLLPKMPSARAGRAPLTAES